MRRGTIAVRVAMPTEFAAELIMLSAYSHQMVSVPVHVSAASSAVEANVMVAAIRATLRRSNASASIPPYRPARIIGMSPATAIMDTANVLPVSTNTCSITVTIVN